MGRKPSRARRRCACPLCRRRRRAWPAGRRSSSRSSSGDTCTRRRPRSLRHCSRRRRASRTSPPRGAPGRGRRQRPFLGVARRDTALAGADTEGARRPLVARLLSPRRANTAPPAPPWPPEPVVPPPLLDDSPLLDDPVEPRSPQLRPQQPRRSRWCPTLPLRLRRRRRRARGPGILPQWCIASSSSARARVPLGSSSNG